MALGVTPSMGWDHQTPFNKQLDVKTYNLERCSLGLGDHKSSPKGKSRRRLAFMAGRCVRRRLQEREEVARGSGMLSESLNLLSLASWVLIWGAAEGKAVHTLVL